ncbi:YadA-like family protein [Aurantiacibacter poecillastricola]|uniref:YadA-like family protein n=1 Tax=Aurantiacibacter poecillastricola TaxID=3064385 RepID=UPI00273E93D2|nr:YadA-like family protein [Aurantiacibacter sp. 219JJ12-13]MDP5261658.1 YadA-like family protein [Aurantiacibacter sp. 219JJ12-13]
MNRLNKTTIRVLSASVAMAGLHTAPFSLAAQAQSLQPVVDVCTGIQLQKSAVTDIVGQAVVPVASSVENLTDELLGLSVLLPPLLNITDADLEVDNILAGIAAEDPISLQLVDTDGNLVGPSDCNISADGYALNDAAGIAIGGNQISGLGDGLAASAAELDAVAFGNNASTSAGAFGAIALGTDASVTVANSVALGAGSLADRGPLTGYSATFMAGTFDSAGSVSVGSAGALRQITNVAPGSAPSDAATVGQVQAAVDGLSGTLGNAVQYDDATQVRVTLGGAAGTTLANVAAGTLSAGSDEAVNGSQLFDTNQQVDANTVAIQANTDAIAAIGSTGDPLGVTYDDASRTRLTFEGAGGTVLANVAAGEVSATSDEAVNGSQLFATNQAVADLDGRVTVNEGDIADLDIRLEVAEADILDLDTRVTVNGDAITSNTTNIASLDNRVTVNEGDITDNSVAIASLDNRVTVNSTTIVEMEQQLANVPLGYVSDTDPATASDVPTDTVALIGASGGAVRITNVADGAVVAGSTDAVNGSQLASTNAAVEANRTDIDINTANIDAITNNLSGSTVVAVQYSDPSDPTASNGGTITQDVTFVGADASQPVRVHNVADGTLANDAVNLGQLQAGMADVMNTSMAYTDQRFELLNTGLQQVAFDLDNAREEAFAGTAGAMAFAGIPQTMDPGRSMFGGAIGHYRGETAFAVGVSTTFNDGEGVLKAGGTMDTNGHGGFSAGAGFSF